MSAEGREIQVIQHRVRGKEARSIHFLGLCSPIRSNKSAPIHLLAGLPCRGRRVGRGMEWRLGEWEVYLYSWLGLKAVGEGARF